MKGCKKLLLLGACALLLAACGKEVVDSRQIDVNDGLAYKHGLSDPYTGTVSFKGLDAMPEAIRTYWITKEKFGFQGWARVTMSAQVDCDVSFTKGLMDGPVKCTNPDGDTLLTATIANEKFDGSSAIHNPLTGKLFAELNWKAGNQEGRQVYYGKDGKTVVDDLNISGGQKDGREIVRTEAGEVYADGTWTQGHPASGTFRLDNGSLFTFADGKKEGPATIYKGAGGAPSKGSFKNDYRDGEWVDPSDLRYEVLNLVQKSGFKSDNTHVIDIINQVGVSSVKSTWTVGKLNGPLQALNRSGDAVLSMSLKNGLVDGVVRYVDPRTRSMTDVTVSNGVLADYDEAPLPTTPEERARANAAALASQGSTSFGNPSSTGTAAPTQADPAASVPQPSASASIASANEGTSATTIADATGHTDSAAKTAIARTYQAGFDCTKAQTPTETTICTDPVLSALDADVAAQYHALTQRANSSQKAELLSRQRVYISARNTCGDDRNCVKRETQNRLLDLRQQATQVPGALISTLQSEHVSGA